MFTYSKDPRKISPNDFEAKKILTKMTLYIFRTSQRSISNQLDNNWKVRWDELCQFGNEGARIFLRNHDKRICIGIRWHMKKVLRKWTDSFEEKQQAQFINRNPCDWHLHYHHAIDDHIIWNQFIPALRKIWIISWCLLFMYTFLLAITDVNLYHKMFTIQIWQNCVWDFSISKINCAFVDIKDWCIVFLCQRFLWVSFNLCWWWISGYWRIIFQIQHPKFGPGDKTQSSHNRRVQKFHSTVNILFWYPVSWHRGSSKIESWRWQSNLHWFSPWFSLGIKLKMISWKQRNRTRKR